MARQICWNASRSALCVWPAGSGGAAVSDCLDCRGPSKAVGRHADVRPHVLGLVAPLNQRRERQSLGVGRGKKLQDMLVSGD